MFSSKLGLSLVPKEGKHGTAPTEAHCKVCPDVSRQNYDHQHLSEEDKTFFCQTSKRRGENQHFQ